MLESPPLVTVLGSPAWMDRIRSYVPSREATVTQYLPNGDLPANLIEVVLDRYPALVIVDGDDPRSVDWITTLRVEQATRRIPVLALGSDVVQEPVMTTAGTIAYLVLSELETRLLPIIQTHARRLSLAEIDRLRCQCAEPLPPLAQLGVRRFNAGAYYAQHDAFEELWMEETGPVRELYRVVLQVGVAYYHISRGNYAGGLKMLRRTVQWFALLPEECQGINVRQLREDATRVRLMLRAMNPADIDTFDRTLFKCVPLLEDVVDNSTGNR